MLRHIVLIRFAPTVATAERDAIFADLARLKDIIAGTMAFVAGPNVSPEALSKGYTHAFTFDFDGEAARDAYLVHPEHQAAGARLVRAAAEGVDGLVVIDVAM